MPDAAPLTDEELARLDRGDVPGVFTARGYTVVRRLIAALRAERAEVEALQDTIDRIDGRPFYNPDAQTLIDRQQAEVERLNRELLAERAEVERLREVEHDLRTALRETMDELAEAGA